MESLLDLEYTMATSSNTADIDTTVMRYSSVMSANEIMTTPSTTIITTREPTESDTNSKYILCINYVLINSFYSYIASYSVQYTLFLHHNTSYLHTLPLPLSTHHLLLL